MFDVYGNLWELSYEWRRDGKSIDAAEAKEGPAAGDRLNFLGGSFHDPASSTTGFGWAAGQQPHSHIGFRVAIVGDLSAIAKDALDLLPRIDPERDTVLKPLKGSWHFEDGALVSPEAASSNITTWTREGFQEVT